MTVLCGPEESAHHVPAALLIFLSTGDFPVHRENVSSRSARQVCTSSPIRFIIYESGLNSLFPAPRTGHFQSSGRSSNRVPGGILPFLSPLSGL